MHKFALAGLILLATGGASFAQVSDSGTSTSTSNSRSGANATISPTVTGSQGNLNNTSTYRGSQSATTSSAASARGGTGRAVGNQVSVTIDPATGGGGGGRGGGRGGGTNGTNGQNSSDPPGTNGINGASSATPGLNYSGGYTLRNTPEIVAPNIAGGNPCLVGVSGGGAGPGIGITLGVGYSDKGCERRNKAALLFNIGQKQEAEELMCDDDAVRAVRLRLGDPCALDRSVQTASVDPAIIRREQAAAAPTIAVVPVAATVRPDWCETASKEELRAHPQCDVH